MNKRILWRHRIRKAVIYLNYRKTFEIEIINEFQSAIHSKMLNFVLNNDFDKSDSKNLQTNLLNQLSNMNQINSFKLSLEELEAYHEYLRAIKKYADSITWKIILQFSKSIILVNWLFLTIITIIERSDYYVK